MAAQPDSSGTDREPAASRLQQALLRRREHYNQRFRMLRALRPGLDGAALGDNLRQWALPLSEALLSADADEAGVDALVESLYELCLALLQGGHSAAEGGPLEALWACLLRHPDALRADPAGLLGRLCNAWLYLHSQPGVRLQDWLDALDGLLQAAAGGPGTGQHLLAATQLLAWRCGMARFRQGALAQAEQLPANWLALALGLPGRPSAAAVRAVLARLQADPWAEASLDEPAQLRLAEVGSIGGFRGLGGAFVEIPEVVLLDGRLLLQDRSGPLQALYADRYGAQLSSDTSGPVTAADSGWLPRLRGRLLQDPVDGHVLELPGAVQSWACDGQTVVVVYQRSYRVRLYARCHQASAT